MRIHTSQCASMCIERCKWGAKPNLSCLHLNWFGECKSKPIRNQTTSWSGLMCSGSVWWLKQRRYHMKNDRTKDMCTQVCIPQDIQHSIRLRSSFSHQANFTKCYTTVYSYVSVPLHRRLPDKTSTFSCTAFRTLLWWIFIITSLFLCWILQQQNAACHCSHRLQP